MPAERYLHLAEARRQTGNYSDPVQSGAKISRYRTKKNCEFFTANKILGVQKSLVFRKNVFLNSCIEAFLPYVSSHVDQVPFVSVKK